MFRVVVNKWDRVETTFNQFVECSFICLSLLYISGAVVKQLSYVAFTVGLYVNGCYNLLGQ